MKKISLIITLIGFNIGIYSQDEIVNGKLTVKSNTDAITTYQTLDNSWLYSEWRNSEGTRKAYMGLSSNLSEFRIALENGTDELIIPSGKIGIGTHNPDEKLHVNGTTTITADIGSPTISHWNTGSHTLELQNSDAGDVVMSFHRAGYSNAAIKHSTLGGLIFSGSGAYTDNHMFLKSNGNVGISTTTPDSKLTVKGKVHAEEVKVDLSVPGPDYVFKEGYNLRSLEEVQDYIIKNGHLPNIPSAKEMETDGVELGIMNMKLLEKIEELTLYILELKEENRKQKSISKQLIQLQARLEKLESKN